MFLTVSPCFHAQFGYSQFNQDKLGSLGADASSIWSSSQANLATFRLHSLVRTVFQEKRLDERMNPRLQETSLTPLNASGFRAFCQ